MINYEYFKLFYTNGQTFGADRIRLSFHLYKNTL